MMIAEYLPSFFIPFFIFFLPVFWFAIETKYPLFNTICLFYALFGHLWHATRAFASDIWSGIENMSDKEALERFEFGRFRKLGQAIGMHLFLQKIRKIFSHAFAGFFCPLFSYLHLSIIHILEERWRTA